MRKKTQKKTRKKPETRRNKRGAGMQRRRTDVVSLRICEWIAATPFTAWQPTMQRCAMLTLRSPHSSTHDMRRFRSSSPGHFFSTSWRARRSHTVGRASTFPQPIQSKPIHQLTDQIWAFTTYIQSNPYNIRCWIELVNYVPLTFLMLIFNRG